MSAATAFPKWLRVFSVVVLLLPLLIPLGWLVRNLLENWQDREILMGIFIAVFLLNMWMPILAQLWNANWRYAPLVHAFCLPYATVIWIQSHHIGQITKIAFIALPALPLLAWGIWRLQQRRSKPKPLG